MFVFPLLVFLLFMFVVQDVLFPATYAALVDQAARSSIPGYSGEVIAWASSMHEGSSWGGMIRVSSVGYGGYVGPESFACINMVGETSTYVSDCFGTPRMCKNGLCPHTGIDYGTDYSEGHPVYTPFGGKVIAVGGYGGWGNTVAIENNGYQVLLTHLSSFAVNEGDIIEAGAIVGLSGGAVPRTPGEATTGPHLHFEIRQCQEDENGVMRCYAVNPRSTLLPGQTGMCDWHAVVTDADRNNSCTK